MKKLLTLFLALGFYTLSIAQSFDSTAWKYATTISETELSKHLHIIASDEYEGRETGRKGQKMAMDYLIKQFKSYGIEDVNNLNYQQAFALVEQKNEGVELSISGQGYTYLEDFSISPFIIKNQTIKGELIFVGYGIEDEKYNNYDGIEVKDKVLFILDGKPAGTDLKEDWSNKKKIELAEEKGAKAIVYYSADLEKNLKQYEHYYKKPRMVLKEDYEEKGIVRVAINRKMTETIFKAAKLNFKKIEKKGWKKGTSNRLEFDLKINKPSEALTGENVLAFIPGTEKEEEIVVLTAHYDHIGKNDSLVFNGADDDGTGTVTLLEIAQAFMQAKKEGHAPKRSVLIMPVSGEEKGLLGSKYYTNHPVFPLENTVVDLNIDMIGRYDKNHESDSNYIYLIGSDKLSMELHELSEEVNDTYMKINLDYTFNDENDPNRFYYRSDHYNFAKNNVPVIFYFSGVHEDYHQASDTVEKIDFKKTERVARLVFLTAWELANRRERIRVDKQEEN
jgi:hypothetical protein